MLGKTHIQIGFPGRQRLDIVWMKIQYDPLVGFIVHSSQLMAFELIDDKQVPRCNRIEFVIDQKLPAAGNGIVDLIAIMDMHIHGFFFFI